MKPPRQGVHSLVLLALVATLIFINMQYVLYIQGHCTIVNKGIADAFQDAPRLFQRQAQVTHLNAGIPKILHHIFLDGEATFWRNATEGDDFSPNYYARKREKGERRAAFKHEWKTSCQRVHEDWIYHFWDMDAALAFIRERYPWFLPTFEEYPDVVAKGDALRPLLLHAMGGLYLDLDVECFRSASPFLDGHDLVLQAEQDNDNALINAVMASTPQHPLWKMVIEKMMERAKTIDGINSIFSATGPQLLSEVYANFTASQHLLGQGVLAAEGNRGQGRLKLRIRGQSVKQEQMHFAQGLTPKVYKLKQFYVPCNWLSQDECEVINAAKVKPAELAGFHHWAGSWKVFPAQ